MAIFFSASNLGFYSSELTYPNLPTDLKEITEERHQELLSELSKGKKLIFDTEGYPNIEEPAPYSIDWDIIRFRRDDLLKQSDWTQLPDVPETIKAKWSLYRQQLRDITQTFASPDLVVFPQPPV